MIKIISALICFVLLISVTRLELSEISNNKIANSIKKLPYAKIFFDLNDVSESKTADSKNANEDERDESQYALNNSINTNFIKYKLYENFYSLNNLYNYQSVVPQSPPDC